MANLIKRIFGLSGEPEHELLELPTEGIVQFYGKWCGACHGIRPAVDRLEQENGVKVTRLEVWGNRGNRRLMEGLSDLFLQFNDGDYTVPAFYDASKPLKDRLLINPLSYEELKTWSLGGREDRRAGRRARKKLEKKYR